MDKYSTDYLAKKSGVELPRRISWTGGTRQADSSSERCNHPLSRSPLPLCEAEVWWCHLMCPTVLHSSHIVFSLFHILLLIVERHPANAVGYRSIVVHLCCRSKEACLARNQNIDYANEHHTSHWWLPAKVMYQADLNFFFSW